VVIALLTKLRHILRHYLCPTVKQHTGEYDAEFSEGFTCSG
jgi:hypothetical protein